MDRLHKILSKLTAKERVTVKVTIKALLSGRFNDLDIKKLKGYENIFRVRTGMIRIIYQIRNKKLNILRIDRRTEKTYKF